MIAGLVAASDIARQRGNTTARRCGWASPTTGSATSEVAVHDHWAFGDHRYYIRIDDDGDPNDESERDFGNAAVVHLDKAVVDAGFLALYGSGSRLRRPYVAESLPETDASLAVDTPSGRVWHRYTFDGYGEKADGSPWALNTPGRRAGLAAARW